MREEMASRPPEQLRADPEPSPAVGVQSGDGPGVGGSRLPEDHRPSIVRPRQRHLQIFAVVRSSPGLASTSVIARFGS